MSRPSASPHWLRCLVLLLAVGVTGWAAQISTQPLSTNALVGATVMLSCATNMQNGGDACTWYRNAVVYTVGTATLEDGVWKLSFTATPADDGAQFSCIISGKEKGGAAAEDLHSDPATITIVPGDTAFALLTPTPGTTITADTTANPPGILFNASRAVQTWQVNYPGTDSTFRAFGTASPGATNCILPLSVLPSVDTAVRIRITSPTSEVVTGNYTLGAQQIAPLVLAPVAFSSPFYFAFTGVPFSVDRQHGLARFVRDPNGDPVTFTKVTGSGLTIHANGSFTWTPPALPGGTTFPGSGVLNQQILAGTFTASDGINPAVGPLELKVTVFANPGDVNRDGVVNMQDVQLVLSSYGQSPGVPTDP